MTDDPASSAPDQDRDPAALSEKGLGRRTLRNTAALVVGRNVNALGRLVIAALVVRTLGASVYGEYALIVVWLTIAEWILDFGTTEVFVREANKDPERRSFLLRVFFGLKILQAPAAMIVLCVGLVVMQYSERVLAAGLLASVSLLFLAGVTLTRASFKASLMMEREIVAEFVSVLTMLGLLLLLPSLGWGLMGLMGAYVVSRAVFLVGCLLQSRGYLDLSLRDVGAAELKWAVTSSFAIGVIGFVVVLHNATDLLILSRHASLEDVAIYSAAQRFTIPLMMGMNAISVSFYPVLAFLDSPERFRETCRRAVETTMVLGGFALVALWCGAEFLLALLSEEFTVGGGVLRVLGAMSVVKAISLVIGPVLFLVGAQNHALAYMATALALKIGVLSVSTPLYGPMGAAGGTLLVEALFLMPATLYIVHRRTGFAVDPLDTLRIVAVVGATIALTRTVLPGGGLLSLISGVALYAIAIVVFRVVRIEELRALLSSRADRD